MEDVYIGYGLDDNGEDPHYILFKTIDDCMRAIFWPHYAEYDCECLAEGKLCDCEHEGEYNEFAIDLYKKVKDCLETYGRFYIDDDLTKEEQKKCYWNPYITINNGYPWKYERLSFSSGWWRD